MDFVKIGEALFRGPGGVAERIDDTLDIGRPVLLSYEPGNFTRYVICLLPITHKLDELRVHDIGRFVAEAAPVADGCGGDEGRDNGDFLLVSIVNFNRCAILARDGYHEPGWLAGKLDINRADAEPIAALLNALSREAA